MTLDEWLRLGIEEGWCGPPVCSTHDGTPMSELEQEAFEEGGDPCLHIIRLYTADVDAAAVERNHSPSVWRKRGLCT